MQNELDLSFIESSESDDILNTYSRDWSLFKVRPTCVVFPKTAQEICELVKKVSSARRNDASNNTLSLTPRAAGTDMTGGPLNVGIILDSTKYLNSVISVKKETQGNQTSFFGHTYSLDGLAVTQPGVFYRDFETETHKQNLEMPCYPASKDIAAVGGMVANNGAGEKSLKFGQNKDFVKSLKVVLYDGEEYEIKPLSFDEYTKIIISNDERSKIYKHVYELIKLNWELLQSKKPKTSKNAAGYLLWHALSTSPAEFEAGNGVFDPTKFFVGAQGTTGIITEITYALTTVEKRSKLLVVFIDDLSIIPTVVTSLMKYDVEMLEMYDDNTFKIGVKFFKDFLKDKGFWGSIKYSLRFMPELKMVITGGIPKLVVLAEFLANDIETINNEIFAAEKDMNDLGLKTHVTNKESEEEKFWDFRHDSFKLLTQHSKETRSSGVGTRTAPFIDDIAINPEFLPEYLPQLIKILDEEKFIYTIAGHLGNGNFHIIPLMDMTLPNNKEKILRISDQVYTLALRYGATITAEHNDGIIRTPYLLQQFGSEIIEVFTQFKNIMDPLSIFNPNKKVGGTKDDIVKYLD